MQQLSLNTVKVWRLRALFLAAVGFFLCGVLAAFNWLAAAVSGAVIAALFLLACLWYCPLRYRTCRWSVTGSAAILTAGVVFRFRRVLPLERVQYAELLRTPAQRLCGVCTLILHAAGAKLSIDGLDNRQGTLLWNRINGRESDEA